MMLFSGNANPTLASALATELNITLGRALVSQFKDGETRVQINEDVRGQDIFLLQPKLVLFLVMPNRQNQSPYHA